MFETAPARAEVAAVRKELAAKDQAVLRAVEAAEAMRKERDDARLQQSTRKAERDAARAALAELKLRYSELEEQRKSVQRQLEEARMCLIDEREARRAKEAERQAASEAAKEATTKLEAALKQLHPRGPTAPPPPTIAFTFPAGAAHLSSSDVATRQAALDFQVRTAALCT